jgi:hypothetical protein
VGWVQSLGGIAYNDMTSPQTLALDMQMLDEDFTGSFIRGYVGMDCHNSLALQFRITS